MNLKNLLTAAALVCASSTAFAAAPVWYGETRLDGCSIDYNITYNDDKTLTINAEIEAEKKIAEYNFHMTNVQTDNVELAWPKLKDEDGDGIFTVTTELTFEPDFVLNWEWYFPIENGLYQQGNTYTVGSSNEAPLPIRVKADAENVTFNSADITYAVTAPEGAEYKVYYKLGDAEAVEATASPVALTGLTEKTEYTCEVYAVMTTDSEPLESRHATVTFKTTAENAQEYVYSDLFIAGFANAFLIGEEPGARRSIFVNIPWSITYAVDGTATYRIDFSEIKIVGLSPQIYWNGFRQLAKVDDAGIYEYNFGAQELDTDVALSHYIAYDGGVLDSRGTPYTKWGMEKTTPEIGEAASITLTVSKNAVKLDETVTLAVVAKDANGYYLPADDVKIEVEGGDYKLEGNNFAVTGSKGTRIVKAIAGELYSQVEIRAIASNASSNLIAGKLGYTNEAHIQSGAVANVTDENLESQLEWACGETQEHYLVYDLGEEYYIEAIDLLFEGAYATEFTVALSKAAPAEIAEPASELVAFAAEDSEDVVFSNTKNDIQHYFTQNPTTAHRYVALRTTEALNTGWGIKVRDLKVYGSKEKIETGVGEIVVENAPVEYFDLSGRRVNTPAAGLYIRRHGNSVSKVLIK